MNKRISLFLTILLAFCLIPHMDAKAEKNDAWIEADASRGIMQAGGLLIPQEESSQADEEAVAKAVELLYAEALKWDGTSEYSPRIKISSAKVPVSASQQLLIHLLNDHPDLFYVKSFSYTYGSGYISDVQLWFNTSYSLDDVTAFYREAEKAVKGTEAAWSDEQKALYLHDWLVTNCEYDLSFTYFNAYDAIVRGSSVCQGYALAYLYLLELCGADCRLITSAELDHAWNLVLIGDSYYYVDCTWDDPVASNDYTLFADYCAHRNFLRSTAGMTAVDHDSTDWVDIDGNDVYNGITTGTDYEAAWWMPTISAIPHVGELWAYESQGKVMLHDYSAGTDEYVFSLTGSDYGWPYHFAALDGVFYASTSGNIRRFNPDGTQNAVVYELSAEEKALGSIYGIHTRNEKLYYMLYSGGSSADFIEEKEVPGIGKDYEFTGFSWEETEDGFAAFANYFDRNNTEDVRSIPAEVSYQLLQEPTCTAEGSGVYKAYISEEYSLDFTVHTEEVIIALPKTEHDYAAVYEWIETEEGGTYEGSVTHKGWICKAFPVCRNCAYTLTEECEWTAALCSIMKEPSCTEEGEAVYTAAFAHARYEEQRKYISIPALGHVWAFDGFSWEGDDENGYTYAEAEYCCARDAAHHMSVAAVITEERKAPTAEEEGFVSYTAAVSAAISPDDQEHTEVRVITLPRVTYRLSQDAASIAVKDSLQLVLIGTDGSEGTGLWSSNNETAATVDENGLVTAHKYGKAVITAVMADGTAYDCAVQTLFWDVADSSKYYFRHVYWAAEKGITKGYDLEYFAPQETCKREQMMTFLWRLAGEPEPKTGSSRFPDVKRGAYYYKAVLWGVENGITNGYSSGEHEGLFGVGLPCTREQAMTFLWRMAGKPEPKTTVNKFADMKKSDYYYKAVLWAAENGIANGYTTGEYAGKYGVGLDCLREHMVTFLSRYSSKIMNP